MDQGDAGNLHYLTQPLDRPGALEGATYKVHWPESDHALYITVNDVIQDSRRRPFEVFINSKNTEHYAWTVALTRMISAVFRRGGDVSFVVEELKAVFDPRGGQWVQGKYVPSLLAAIGQGTVVGATLDVFNDEPLPPESPLWTASGVSITPHIAGVTHVEEAGSAFLAALATLEAGGTPSCSVNPRREY